MTSFTTPKTWSAATLTAAELNEQIRDNEKNIDERLTIVGITSVSAATNKIKSAQCGVRCTSSGTTTANDSTDKTVSWDSEDYDTDGFHSTVSNTSRITIPSGLDGTYLFTALIPFEFNATGDREVWIENQAGTVKAQVTADAPPTAYRSEIIVTAVIVAAAADWFAVHVMQNSGGARQLDINLSRAHFGAWRLFAA